MPNFYVYRITNKILRKHYYGSRKTNLDPKCDLGIKYFSSSRDKEFIKDQKENPQNYRYKIIRIYDNFKFALDLEIKLHNKFDVAKNEHFYNLSKQSSNKFICDIPRSEEWKRKIGLKSKGRKHSEETRKKLSNVKFTDERRKNISNAKKGKPSSRKGKHFSSESLELLIQSHRKFKGIKVSQYDLQMNFIKEFNDAYEISENKFIIDGVLACCNGRIKTTRGFIYKFSKQNIDNHK